MSATLNLTETQIFTALRSFLVALLPNGTEVVKGQDNRAAEPVGSNFIVMTPILRERIETNSDQYIDGSFNSQPQVGNSLQPVKLTVQLDFHGISANDNLAIVTTIFRDEWAVAQFATSGFDVTPLHMSEPRQVPYLNGEQQIETRWSVDALLQCNQIVTLPQDFAATLHVTPISVKATYH